MYGASVVAAWEGLKRDIVDATHEDSSKILSSLGCLSESDAKSLQCDIDGLVAPNELIDRGRRDLDTGA